MQDTRTGTLLLAALIALLFTATGKAQNIQVQYDFERKCVTSTVEMFRPDSFGSTYFFVDMDYTPRTTGAMLCGKFKKITATMYILAVLFILKYIFL